MPDDPALKISIVTPVRNGERYLRRCIESVLSQDYPQLEHVFVDSLSDDATPALLEEYRVKYPDRITYVSEKDEGPGDGWNKGIRLASGDIIGWLGVDDELAPGAAGKVAGFFTKHRDAKFVYGECELLDESGESIGYFPTADFDRSVLLNRRNFIPCTSAFYRKGIFETIGRFDNEGNDYECWLRASEHFPLERLRGEVLSRFRVHESGHSSATENRLHILRRTYLASRRHGGSRFSFFSLLYHGYALSEKLKPLLGWAYPALKKLFRVFYPHSLKRPGGR